MVFFKKLLFVFRYGDEILSLIKKENEEKREADRKLRQYNLNLCLAHQQERNRSHYSEHNCDYCKLQKEISNLKKQIISR